MEWEVVIGLEIHVQLSTRTKIFSGSSTAFGAEANTQANAIDLALPGTLPVLNENALRMAVMFGLAINADIAKRSVFERKNYFYPDLPKGYQTTQLAEPIVGRGFVDIQLDNGIERRVYIHHAHLEEDAGKSLHEDFHGMTGIDLNRAGTPLVEIVSEPDMRSSKEAAAYAKKIHALVTTLGICDGNMAEGSMRCDCNVSIRPMGQTTLGTRTELKNINSFRFIERAIDTEVARQIDLLEDGGHVKQETRLYDPEKNQTRSMRSKEDANDYRYFPCPDLLPVIIDDAYIASIKADLPELPDARCKRFIEELGLSQYDATLLTSDRYQADFFEQLNALVNNPKLAANWILGEVSRCLNQHNEDIQQSPVSVAQLGELLVFIQNDEITNKTAKYVFEKLWQEGGSAAEIIVNEGLKQENNSGALEEVINQVIEQCTTQVNQYVDAEPEKRGKMLGFFMGQIMKKTQGKANPAQVQTLLKDKLDRLTKS